LKKPVLLLGKVFLINFCRANFYLGSNSSKTIFDQFFRSGEGSLLGEKGTFSTYKEPSPTNAYV